MSKKRKLCLSALLLCLIFRANSFAATVSRDEVVAQKLKCAARQTSGKSVAWGDVCALDPAATAAQSPARIAAIEQALNDATAGPIEKKSSAPEHPVIKVSPPVGAAAPAKKISMTSRPKAAPLPPSNTYDGTPTKPKSELTIKKRKHSFGLSPEVFYAQYEEPEVMNQEGTFYGVSARYAYRPGPEDPFYFDGIYYGLQGQWAYGKMNYSSASTGNDKGLPNYIWEIRGLFGGEMSLNSSLRGGAYTGFGYRFLWDRSEGRQTDLGYWGYDRKQEYYYLPLGVDFFVQANAVTSVDANVEFDYMFWGHNTSKTGYLPGYSDMEFDQNRGIGIKASVKMIAQRGGYDLFFEPFWRYWEIPDSTIMAGYVEPYNKTREVGLKLGIEF